MSSTSALRMKLRTLQKALHVHNAIEKIIYLAVYGANLGATWNPTSRDL